MIKGKSWDIKKQVYYISELYIKDYGIRFFKGEGEVTDSWTYGDYSFKTSAIVIMAYNYVYRINEMKRNSNRTVEELFRNYDTYPELLFSCKERNFYMFDRNIRTVDLLCFFDEGGRDKMFYVCYYINSIVMLNGSFSNLIMDTYFK